MLKRFFFAREDRPDQEWLARFTAGREEAERWYFGKGQAAPLTANDCRAALRAHMPELMPHYDRVCDLVGDDNRARQILSHYRPAPIVNGCSQAVWLGNGGPALVRNYDYPLDIVSDRFEATSWAGCKVICKAQRPWGGCLDGMNEYGLVASCTFGGSPVTGQGFSIILMLRYALEVCRRVDEAIEALRRIPIAQSHNVTLIDSTGAYATIFLGPDRTPAVTTDEVCTNHQEHIVWPEHGARSRTIERYHTLACLLAEPNMTLDRFVENFLHAPLYSRWIGSPTVYTAVYRPTEKLVHYLWPGRTICQLIDRFEPGEHTHDYGDLLP